MISRSEIKSLLEREPAFDDIRIGLRAIQDVPKGIVKEAREVMAIARKFNEEVVRPHALKLDNKMQEDPGHIEWDLVKKANDWGFYSMWIPKMFGGKGYCFTTFAFFAEEIASECLSMVNMIGAHLLGYTTPLRRLNGSDTWKISFRVYHGTITQNQLCALRAKLRAGSAS
ncbi:MAG: acyl-CoA dehydrogenase family protein [Proteobacteria bacterium]|nr:acyl-CoA dehydrogenase family protein [Pseudomonadota bacterium]